MPDVTARNALGIPDNLPDFVVRAAIAGGWVATDEHAHQFITAKTRTFGKTSRGWRWAESIPNTTGGEDMCEVARTLLTSRNTVEAWERLKQTSDPVATAVALLCEATLIRNICERDSRPSPTKAADEIWELTTKLEKALSDSGFLLRFDVTASQPLGDDIIDALSRIKKVASSVLSRRHCLSAVWSGYDGTRPSPGVFYALRLTELLRSEGVARGATAAAVAFSQTLFPKENAISPGSINQELRRHREKFK
jgi:hypothetical protein